MICIFVMFECFQLLFISPEIHQKEKKTWKSVKKRAEVKGFCVFILDLQHSTQHLPEFA